MTEPEMPEAEQNRIVIDAAAGLIAERGLRAILENPEQGAALSDWISTTGSVPDQEGKQRWADDKIALIMERSGASREVATIALIEAMSKAYIEVMEELRRLEETITETNELTERSKEE